MQRCKHTLTRAHEEHPLWWQKEIAIGRQNPNKATPTSLQCRTAAAHLQV